MTFSLYCAALHSDQPRVCQRILPITGRHLLLAQSHPSRHTVGTYSGYSTLFREIGWSVG
jgi:hypothetical protein